MVYWLALQDYVCDSKVDVGRESPIEVHFPVAVLLARNSFGEVHEVETDGLSKLVHPIAKEEQNRDMGFDDARWDV